MDEMESGKSDGAEKSDGVIARLGHELGNLLAPIRNALRLMEHARADPRTIEYARGVIRQQLAELEKLTERLTGGEIPGADIEPPRRSQSILIVDDNRAWVDSLSEVLRNSGYTVYSAYGGREAVAMASDLKPDVVLLDIEMPEMSGYEAARRVRQHLADHPVQIIAVSVWARESDRTAARLAGFNHHLTKPLILDELEKILPN
ncbi:MAG TPA: response regulator [Burkholderiales bacterium]|jgi:CheY-like chemotaxis protein